MGKSSNASNGGGAWFYFRPRRRRRGARRADAILSSVSTIAVPIRFGPDQVASWIAAWSDVARIADLRVTIPAGAVLEPCGIVLLAAGIARRRGSGLRTWMSFDPGADDALTRMHEIEFFRELSVEPEATEPAEPGRRGVPLRCIANLEVARRQADATRLLLESAVPTLPPSTVRAAQFVFEELGANVVQHSGAADTGFGLAIADDRRRRIQIAFCDAGVGFRQSLQTNQEFAGRVSGDGEAIRLALDKRVTRGGSGNIGMGLFLLASLAERVRGNLWIATGDALLARRGDSPAADGDEMQRTAGWQGAWLCLDAPVPGW